MDLLPIWITVIFDISDPIREIVLPDGEGGYLFGLGNGTQAGSI
jgi:hypothetical protein